MCNTEKQSSTRVNRRQFICAVSSLGVAAIVGGALKNILQNKDNVGAPFVLAEKYLSEPKDSINRKLMETYLMAHSVIVWGRVRGFHLAADLLSHFLSNSGASLDISEGYLGAIERFSRQEQSEDLPSATSRFFGEQISHAIQNETIVDGTTFWQRDSTVGQITTANMHLRIVTSLNDNPDLFYAVHDHECFVSGRLESLDANGYRFKLIPTQGLIHLVDDYRWETSGWIGLEFGRTRFGFDWHDLTLLEEHGYAKGFSISAQIPIKNPIVINT